MRTAISRVRVATMNAMTPSTPSDASSSTMPPATATEIDSATTSCRLLSFNCVPVTIP
jgi:hypothetical protein